MVNYHNICDILSLYTATEVASFISYKRFKGAITPYCVGEVNDKISIEGSPGEIFIYTIDGSVSYLDAEHTVKGFIVHPYYGKLRIGDAGYIKDNELYVLGKANDVLTNNNTLIDMERIRFIAESQDFVNNTMLLKEDNKLVLILGINGNFLLSSGMTWESVIKKCNKLKLEINSKVNDVSKVFAVLPFPDIRGLKTKNYKLVSRQT